MIFLILVFIEYSLSSKFVQKYAENLNKFHFSQNKKLSAPPDAKNDPNRLGPPTSFVTLWLQIYTERTCRLK